MYVRTHTYMRRCLLLSIITGVLMTSDEVNSSTGKKLVIFEERRKRGGTKFELIQHLELVEQKQMLELVQHLNRSNLNYPAFELIRLELIQHLNLPDLNVSVAF